MVHKAIYQSMMILTFKGTHFYLQRSLCFGYLQGYPGLCKEKPWTDSKNLLDCTCEGDERIEAPKSSKQKHIWQTEKSLSFLGKAPDRGFNASLRNNLNFDS